MMLFKVSFRIFSTFPSKSILNTSYTLYKKAYILYYIVDNVNTNTHTKMSNAHIVDGLSGKGVS